MNQQLQAHKILHIDEVYIGNDARPSKKDFNLLKRPLRRFFLSKIKAPKFPGMDLNVLKSYIEVNEQAGGLFPVQSCACGINQE